MVLAGMKLSCFVPKSRDPPLCAVPHCPLSTPPYSQPHLLFQGPLQSIHPQLLLAQTGLVSRLLLLCFASDLSDLSIGPAGKRRAQTCSPVLGWAAPKLRRLPKSAHESEVLREAPWRHSHLLIRFVKIPECGDLHSSLSISRCQGPCGPHLSSFSSACTFRAWYRCSSFFTRDRYSWAHFFSTSSFYRRGQRLRQERARGEGETQEPPVQV